MSCLGRTITDMKATAGTSAADAAQVAQEKA